MSGGRNSRSPEAQAYRHLYRDPRWRRLRKRVLIRDRFRCQKTGVILLDGRRLPNSAVVHHKKPHKGDPDLFFDEGNCIAVAKEWHDRHGKADDVFGYGAEIGEDGLPLDPAHPFNKVR